MPGVLTRWGNVELVSFDVRIKMNSRLWSDKLGLFYLSHRVPSECKINLTALALTHVLNNGCLGSSHLLFAL